MNRTAERLAQYALLMRLDRPIGTLLLLWPTLWGLWLAGQGQPKRSVVLTFIFGVWLMRSAGCVINDIADRNFDPHVERTRSRPLAAKRVSVREALALFLSLCGVSFLLVLPLGALSVGLAIVGVGLAASYPFMKRFHHFPQVHLGAAFGWGIIMAYGALMGSVPLVAWWLFLANVVWSVVYDTQYAMVDREDDLKIGVKSTAILFGERDKWIIGRLQVVLLLMLVVVGLLEHLGWPYYLSLLIGAWSALYQQYLIRNREPQGCFQAFLHNNWFGLSIFCGIVLSQLP